MTAASATTATPSALAEPYPLTPDLVAAFRRDGHVRLPGLLSRAEVDAYRPVIAAAVAADAAAQDPKDERTPEQRLFPAVVHLWRRHDAMRRLSFARRLTKTVTELLGCRSLRLYHDGSMFKASGGPGTPWHQDGYYMPVQTDRVVTLWLALDDVSADMGTLSFASGSHRDGQVQRQAFSAASVADLETQITQRHWPVVHSGAMCAGDATIHMKWTAHSVPPNTSGRLRAAVAIIYVDAEARLLDSLDPLDRMMIHCNLGDQPPGALPDDRFNPTVYRADDGRTT